MKLIQLLVIIGSNVIVTKIIGIVLVLLSFFIKGSVWTSKRWKKEDWDAFFLTTPDRLILLWGAGMYFLSSIFATCITYALFCLFDFQYPIVYAGTLFVLCSGATCINYHRKEKKRILEKLSSLRQIIKE